MLENDARVIHPKKKDYFGTVVRPTGNVMSGRIHQYLVRWDDGLVEEWWEAGLRVLSPLERLAEAADEGV